MKKIVLSEKNDFWYSMINAEGFYQSLLISFQPIENIQSAEICLDELGKPHLFLVTSNDFLYFYWDGVFWRSGAKPEIYTPTEVYSTFRNKTELNLLVCHQKNSYIHYVLTETRWLSQMVPFLNESTTIKVFSPWNQSLTLIYFSESYFGNYLGLAIYNKKWDIHQKINIKTSQFCGYHLGENYIFLLLSDENSAWGSKIITVPYQEPHLVTEYNCSLKGLFGQSVIHKQNSIYKIYWVCQGKLQFATIDSENYQVLSTSDSNIFFPTEILIPTGTMAQTGYVCLSTVYGTQLEFPLILSTESLENMIKGLNLNTKANFKKPSRSF